MGRIIAFANRLADKLKITAENIKISIDAGKPVVDWDSDRWEAAKPYARKIRLQSAQFGTRFGPWAAEEEFHHVSRQTCRAYLRALWFNKISKEQPQLSRRDRRRVSRVFSKIEYRGTVSNVK